MEYEGCFYFDQMPKNHGGGLQGHPLSEEVAKVIYELLIVLC